ncbi:hypothetical protein AJ80_00713 [Polytolypa hystricis UAMH7299]|uniref:Holocytochrome c-type synthase n=1 Tax=Polytolypa hystricis (strain UAMH7299) TaxID=1447883 RepID=A0A2B7Z2M5_POLH7|nr:hypothetical protein AJ80_00713 [Polytolypa hystricis UAMH7299]
MGANASTPTAPPSEPPAAACPVDHKTREVWLQQNQGAAPPHPLPPSATASAPSPKSKPSTKEASTTTPTPASKLYRALSLDREVSNIPRALPDVSPSPSKPDAAAAAKPPSPYAQQPATPSPSPTASHASPSNDESETGHDPRTGNWIYPSERQFFEALVRKSNTSTTATSASDLATSVASIIPIHNAVNERAWMEILSWESKAPASDPGSRKCGGPKLYSFRGLGVDSQFVSPRARVNGLLGYQLPFDRHDWVVERCGGQRVEYVIDFYQGRSNGGGGGAAAGLTDGAKNGKLSFYLDVRPKLNTWEGCRMRMFHLVGL